MPRNGELPGIENPNKIAAIDAVAEDYITARDKANKAKEKMTLAKDMLIEACRENVAKMGKRADGTKIYRYDDVLVEFSNEGESVAVKAIKEAKEEDED